MDKHRIFLVTFLLLAATGAGSARAQAELSQDSVVRAALARIAPGKQIRLHAAGLGRLEGALVSLTDTSVTLDTPSTPTSVVMAGIDSVWQRQSAAGNGGFLGAVLGGAIGGVAAYKACPDEGCGAVAAIGAGIGVLGGAAVGALIGSNIPKWSRRFP